MSLFLLVLLWYIQDGSQKLDCFWGEITLQIWAHVSRVFTRWLMAMLNSAQKVLLAYQHISRKCWDCFRVRNSSRVSDSSRSMIYRNIVWKLILVVNIGRLAVIGCQKMYRVCLKMNSWKLALTCASDPNQPTRWGRPIYHFCTH